MRNSFAGLFHNKGADNGVNPKQYNKRRSQDIGISAKSKVKVNVGKPSIRLRTLTAKDIMSPNPKEIVFTNQSF